MSENVYAAMCMWLAGNNPTLGCGEIPPFLYGGLLPSFGFPVAGGTSVDAPSLKAEIERERLRLRFQVRGAGRGRGVLHVPLECC